MTSGDQIVHHYRATCRWDGSTAGGYDAYPRAHDLACPPATGVLHLSSDPAFLGDPTLLNPEQLLLGAASSCQLLSFLAVAARARVVVLGYVDTAEAEMAAIAGLVFAVSRPLAGGWLGLTAGGRADTTIVLLDRSPSMQQAGTDDARSIVK